MRWLCWRIKLAHNFWLAEYLPTWWLCFNHTQWYWNEYRKGLTVDQVLVQEFA